MAATSKELAKVRTMVERARLQRERATKTKKQSKKGTQRKRKPLLGKDAIGVRVGNVLNKYKVGKHFVLDI